MIEPFDPSTAADPVRCGSPPPLDPSAEVVAFTELTDQPL